MKVIRTRRRRRKKKRRPNTRGRKRRRRRPKTQGKKRKCRYKTRRRPIAGTRYGNIGKKLAFLRRLWTGSRWRDFLCAVDETNVHDPAAQPECVEIHMPPPPQLGRAFTAPLPHI